MNSNTHKLDNVYDNNGMVARYFDFVLSKYEPVNADTLFVEYVGNQKCYIVIQWWNGLVKTTDFFARSSYDGDTSIRNYRFVGSYTEALKDGTQWTARLISYLNWEPTGPSSPNKVTSIPSPYSGQTTAANKKYDVYYTDI